MFSALGGEMKSFGRILSEGGNTKEWLMFVGIVTSIIIAVLAFKWQSRRVQRHIEMRRKLEGGGGSMSPASVVPMRTTTTTTIAPPSPTHNSIMMMDGCESKQ